MDITVYKLIHVIGFLLVFQALGASVALAGSTDGSSWRRLSTIGHGIGMLLLLVAGFGMLAKLELFGAFPAWVWVKMGVWLVLGALPFVMRRKPSAATAAWWGAVLLGALAAVMAIFKPF